MSDTGTDFDLALLTDKLEGDEELARELAQVYCEDAPIRLAELQDAFSRGDLQAVMKTAHSLKGMSGVVRIDRLAMEALRIENAAKEGDMDLVRSLVPPFSGLFDRIIVEVNASLRD